ncbi:MAG: hypothetical protein NC913_07030 [Candidatus Omnitrophica bacterium]|nr:hypothetical protein [Candidatus Omnitrophota bacterium]
MKELSKRERVERTLNLQAVDRVAIHDQVSFNPDVISYYTGKKIDDFNYSVEDICQVIRKTLDMTFMPSAPKGRKRWVDEYGITYQNDNWTTWTLIPPNITEEKLKKIICDKIKIFKKENLKNFENEYKERIFRIKNLIGDDTVIYDFCTTVGLCELWNHGFIEPLTYLIYDEPELIQEYFEVRTAFEISKAEIIGRLKLYPVILIPDDLASKTGPIFAPEVLKKYFFPYLKKQVDVWHSFGIKVIYHSDGNYKILIDEFIKCGVDGFYCLEPSCGMDIVELKNKYPNFIWAGGVDGVDLMERGSVFEVEKEVKRQIYQTDALNKGGIFIGTSSEVNPMIKYENFVKMVETAKSIKNEKI